MAKPFISLVVAAVFGCTVAIASIVSAQEPLEISDLPDDREVSFSKDVLPILRQNCIACHNSTDAESGVNLESVKAMRSSEIEETLVPGDATASYLFQLAAHLEEPIMPPEDNDVSARNLTGDELALLKRWIEQGAEDDAMAPTSESEWRQLPSQVKTAYATAMSADGRLSAVSFANQIRVFGKRGPAPLEQLGEEKEGVPQSPHVDFVHALELAGDGELIFSAGFRNVHVWKRATPTELPIPSVSDQVTTATLSANGNVMATFSSVGEISVSEVGELRWNWLRGFDFEHEKDAEESPLLAVNNQGDLAALAAGSKIYFARSTADVVFVESDSLVSCIQFLDDQTALTGHKDGRILKWSFDKEWHPQEVHNLGDAVHSFTLLSKFEGILALAQGGDYVQLDRSAKIVGAGKCPQQPRSLAALEENRFVLATANGVVGGFNTQSKEWTEFDKSEPSLVTQHAEAEWRRLVGERLVSALEAEQKKTTANQEAEQKSLEKNKTDLAARIKTKEEQTAKAAEYAAAVETAQGTLKSKQDEKVEVTGRRSKLEQELAAADEKIKEMTAELEELKRAREAKQQELSKLPDVKALDAEVAKAEKSVEAGEKVLVSAKQALELTLQAVTQLEQASVRIESRIKALEAEAADQNTRLEQERNAQAQKQKHTEELKRQRDASKATESAVFAIAGSEAVALSNGVFQTWTATGDWQPMKASLAPGTKVEAAGGRNLLLREPSGKHRVLQISSKRWELSQVLGSASGESPFADRVLALAVSPDGRLLATGGGAPSRAGEILVWKIDEAGNLSHSQTIAAPHQDTVLSLRFSPDGKTLASSSADRMIKLWNVETGEQQKALEGHTHHVTAIAWSVTGRQLFSASADKTIKIWDVAAAKATRTIQGLKSEVTNLADVGRDNRLAVVTGDGYFRVYRADNGATETNQEMQGDYLYGLARDREGTSFIVSGVDGFAQQIDKAGKKQADLSHRTLE